MKYFIIGKDKNDNVIVIEALNNIDAIHYQLKRDDISTYNIKEIDKDVLDVLKGYVIVNYDEARKYLLKKFFEEFIEMQKKFGNINTKICEGEDYIKLNDVVNVYEQYINNN